MAQISNGTLHTWADGETVTASNMNQNMSLIQAAHNDTDNQVQALPNTYYNKTTVDQKISSMATTTAIASGASFPVGTNFNEGQLFWRTDLKQMYAWSISANNWVFAQNAPSSVTNAMLTANPNFGFPNRLRPSIANFVRNSVAWRRNFSQVVANQIRTEMGAMGDAPYIEESTSNIGDNTGFETVTGTATVFSDALTSYTGSTVPAPWTLQSGGFSFGASGATSGASSAYMTAGNANWKPITGSNGSALGVTIQATFTPASSSNVMFLRLYQDSNNFYSLYWDATNIYIQTSKNGTLGSQAVFASTKTASSAYTFVLTLSTGGSLTYTVYNGVGTGGSVVKTNSWTDPSPLTGGFLIGVGGDTGVIIKSAQVTAPFADGWTIGGDSRVAWALTNTNPIAGNYSVNAVGFQDGVLGHVDQNITGQPTGNYTLSGYVSTTNVSAGGAYIHVDDGTVNADSTKLTGTNSTTRLTAQFNPSSATNKWINLRMNGTGTATFDCIQLEQKAYATSYIENSATSGSVTRSADSLSYTLHAPLPSRWFGAFRWIPDQASSSYSARSTAPYILTGTNKSGSQKYLLNYSTNFAFSKYDGSSWKTVSSSAIPFNAGDVVTILVEDDPVTAGQMILWVGVNGGTLQQFTLANTTQITDCQSIYTGCSNVLGAEANGTVEPLITATIPTTEQLNWLYNAPLWGQGNFPDVFQPNTGWVAPTLLNGWVNYGGAFSNAQYMKDSNGFVHLTGDVKSGTGNIICYLPSGYRPSTPKEFILANWNGSTFVIAECTVGTDGSLYMNLYNNTRLSLDGIVFKAEQ